DPRAHAPAGYGTDLHEDAVLLTELALAEVRQRLLVCDPGGAAPSLLRERQVHADCPHLDVAELGGLLVEAPRLRVAHRRVEGRGRAEEQDLAARVGKVRGAGAPIRRALIGRALPDLALPPAQRDRIASKHDHALAFVGHGALLCPCRDAGVLTSLPPVL